MTERTRNQIIEWWRGGASIRAIARELGISRSTVCRVIDEVEAARSGGADPLPPKPNKRPSKLDDWQQTIAELLARYPRITATRVHQELASQGYRGGYTMVREKVRALRPSPSRSPVVRFETGPGAQAQMDYATYTIDFTDEGRRRVHLFGYILGYSRRQYLRFVEHQDFATTVRQHIKAFEHLGGVAATCLYDNMKVVVHGYDGAEPIYNPRFLAFATHYGYRPRACKPRRPQTKGKVEKSLAYVESSLLGGRTFRSLEHLNEVTAWWLANIADLHVHRTTGARPIDRHAEERPHLIPLPGRHYDPSPVVYRVADAEQLVAWRDNQYSVPWQFIGKMLPVRITDCELIVYSPAVEQIARHRLFADGTRGNKSILPEHRPTTNGKERLELLRQRYHALGATASQFLDGLLASCRHGKGQAQKVLALLGTYRQADLVRALERAVRYRAFSLRAVERILATTARPKGLLELLADDVRQRLGQIIHPDPPIQPRPSAEYQSLLDQESSHGQDPQVQDERHNPPEQAERDQREDGNPQDAAGQP